MENCHFVTCVSRQSEQVPHEWGIKGADSALYKYIIDNNYEHDTLTEGVGGVEIVYEDLGQFAKDIKGTDPNDD